VGIAGGESKEIGLPATLIVDGIHHVARILELAESGLLDEVRFIEAWACQGGCLGGPLTVQNPFWAKYHLEERLSDKLRVTNSGLEKIVD
jgi:iron only hydrogenase large subunit-like protein